MSYSFRFPYSIFIYQAPLRPGGQPRWYEVLRADDRQWAEYVAGLLHNAGTPVSPETKPVLKVVRYGNTLLALPDAATVERVERVIAKYQPQNRVHGYTRTQKRDNHIARCKGTRELIQWDCKGKVRASFAREDAMTTLREWLNRLKQFDPDDWGEITQLQTEFSEEELNGELEAEIAFDTVGGTVEHVTIRLIDNSQDVIVDLDYTVLQLDVVPLTDFILESVFGTDEESEGQGPEEG